MPVVGDYDWRIEVRKDWSPARYGMVVSFLIQPRARHPFNRVLTPAQTIDTLFRECLKFETVLDDRIMYHGADWWKETRAAIMAAVVDK